MMELVPLVAMSALVIALVNFVKNIRAKNTNGWVTQLCVWAGGVAVVTLTAQTDFAASVEVAEGITLATTNFWTQVFAGLAFGGTAMLVNEFKQAIDNQDSAKRPPLV